MAHFVALKAQFLSALMRVVIETTAKNARWAFALVAAIAR